ncbi:hypothetical protein JKP88DRAFT_298986 [Tribonema minus]|uniref:Uncharacterized protein n=1 Tax=Tribonema minus TaxID=303371 RepID=A0A836CM46_9STRA|nr:hypothetical protein JKP88DRAFT_298986 [Tribonema minus]
MSQSCIDSVLAQGGATSVAGHPIAVQWAWGAASDAAQCRAAPPPSIQLMLDVSGGRRTLLQQWPVYMPPAVTQLPEGNGTQALYPLPAALQNSTHYFFKVGDDGTEGPDFEVSGPGQPIAADFAASCTSDCCIDVQSPAAGDVYPPGAQVNVTWSAFGRGCGTKYAVDLLLDASGGGLRASQQLILSAAPTRVSARAPRGSAAVALPPQDAAARDVYYFRVANTDARGRGFDLGDSQSSVALFRIGAPSAGDENGNGGTSPVNTWEKPAADANGAGGIGSSSSGGRNARHAWSAVAAAAALMWYMAIAAL